MGYIFYLMGIIWIVVFVVVKENPMQPGDLLLDRFAFVFVMLVMFCMGAHYQFGILNDLSMQKNLWHLFGVICLFFAAYGVYLANKCWKIMKAKAQYPVHATCVMYDSQKGDYGTQYAPVYLFHYRGDRYAVCNHVYESKKRMPAIGKSFELFIDPEDPIFFCTHSGIRRNVMKLLACSLFFAGFGIGVFYYVAYLFH